MDLAIGIIMIVVASIFLILATILIVGGIIEGGFEADGTFGTIGATVAGIIFMVIGICTTVPASKSYDYVETYIASFHPNSEEFVIGMSQGKSYYMLDANDSNLIEKNIHSSKLVRDEELNPYIQKVSEFGSKDVTYYIHIPADTVIFIM